VKSCEWCNNVFKPSVSYQIYCSTNCRDEATKEKIIERHRFLKVQNRSKKTRMCSGGCGTKLSIYNDETLCNQCNVNIKEVNLKLREIKRIINETES
jgi:hypothetical protein